MWWWSSNVFENNLDGTRLPTELGLMTAMTAL